MLDGTIVAVASAQGPARRAILRLSGPDAFAAVAALTHLQRSRGIAPVTLTLPIGELRALALTMPAPRSYTGEDCIELQVPANPSVLAAVIKALLAHAGVRPAEPGEFTARAVLAGRLGLDEAEAIGAMVAARSESDLAAARALATGATGAAIGSLADELATLLALVEAGIDFTDQEDVVAIAPAELDERLAELRGRLVECAGRERAEPSEPLVALVGPPSAGKSTLFNALLGRTRAVVDEQPGTTRDALVEPIVLEGVAIRLMDLPGLDAQEDGVQSAARAALARADALVVCDDRGLFARPPDERPTLRVRTKCDRIDSSGVGLAVCALDGTNLGALASAIGELVMGGGSEHGTLIARHRRHVARAIEHIDGARSASLAVAPERVAAPLRLALDELGAITGAIGPDEVLGRVFATFCVGK